jgi:hypothetical protein
MLDKDPQEKKIDPFDPSAKKITSHPAPISDEKSKPAVVKTSKLASAYIRFTYIAFFVTAVSFMFCKPAHTVESIIYCLCITIPFVIASFVASIFVMKNQWLLQPRSIDLVFVYLGMTFVVTAFFFAGNVILDHSLADSKTIQIVGKHIRTNKGSRHYQVEVQTPLQSLLPFSIDNTDDVSIYSESEYAQVIPYKSRVTIKIHPGFFHMPWYEDKYFFTGLGHSRSTSPSIPDGSLTNSNKQELISQACNWRKSFNFNSDIEVITPDDYHRDFWPGGEPRSVEPMVQGKNHGMGHYTFANGRVYGDIPWQHGNKHGFFTLYREDGSVDQILSYKDGHPFGINEWYEPNGQLKIKWLYLDETKTLPASACDSSSP